MLEKSVEDHLRQEVERRGGRCIKMNPAGNKGIPDRLVLLPNGVVMFVELKRPKGGVLAQLQAWWRDEIRLLGGRCEVIATKSEVDALLRAARVDQHDQRPG